MPKVFPGRVMSQDLYCRFLNYRSTMANTRGGHRTQFYTMSNGTLPNEITDNLLRYSEIINLPKTSHRIDRYDILVALFYSFLMNRWKDGEHSFLAHSQMEADKQWRVFFNLANSALNDLGYETLSYKNPLDALLRIALHSVSPLECYGRIYELNILSSLSRNAHWQKDYPPPERVSYVVSSLLGAYDRLSQTDAALELKSRNLRDFCENVMRALPKTYENSR